MAAADAEDGGVSADGGSTDGTALAEARILVQGQVRCCFGVGICRRLCRCMESLPLLL